MWRTTASATGTGGTTLRAGGCRGESSTAGACSPLVSAGMSCCRRTSGIFPLSDHVQMLCILAGMDQKDTYAVGFGGDDTSRAVFFLPCQGCSSSSSLTEWWTFLFYEYGFSRPSLEREVQSDFRVHSSSCGAHCGVVHSPFEWLDHRCHCSCRSLVLFVGRLPCCGGVCVAMSCGGGSFTPDGAYDSVWDSVKPMTGKFFFNSFQYQEFVGCVCMLNFLVQQQ